MSLYDKPPIKKYPFIVVTGVTFGNCLAEGLPADDEFPNLQIVSDSVQHWLSKITKILNAGTFTYQCQRLDYIYVEDTLLLRHKLEELYLKKFKQYKYYLNIKKDDKWGAYLTFLYPNEEIMEEISNSKVVIKLKEAGDKLDKARLVEHWIYFKNTTDRDSFIVYAKSNGFEIVEKTTEKGEHPYSLHIARNDKVTLDEIDKVTLGLRRQAKKMHGDYDGWESVVVK